MVIVDTSVWIDHFRHGNNKLVKLLESGEVAIHSMILGELTLGNLKDRSKTLDLLGRMTRCTEARPEEVFHLIETSKLHGKGIGWVDANLIASALLSKADILTLDKKLMNVFRSKKN